MDYQPITYGNGLTPQEKKDKYRAWDTRLPATEKP